jgi:hypothetical protein
MNLRSFPLAVITVCFGALVCHAQFHVLAGDEDEDGCSGKTPARICTGSAGEEHCYAPPSEMLYTFGLEPEALPIGELNSQPLILFFATFSGCGSGTLTDYSLLTIRSGEFIKLSPKIQLTNQSEYKLWDLPEYSPLPILVTADFLWDFKTETHFSHHRYRIHAYLYDPRSGQYLEKLHFDTTKNIPASTTLKESMSSNPKRKTSPHGCSNRQRISVKFCE